MVTGPITFAHMAPGRPSVEGPIDCRDPRHPHGHPMAACRPTRPPVLDECLAAVYVWA